MAKVEFELHFSYRVDEEESKKADTLYNKIQDEIEQRFKNIDLVGNYIIKSKVK